MSESHSSESSGEESSSESHESAESCENSNEHNNQGSCEHKDGRSEKKESPKASKSRGKGAKKGERTLNGAVALIYYEGPEGIEFYLEEKPKDYALPQYRGKLSLVGGTIETTDQNSLEALVRELTEEIESEEAQSILISILRQHKEIYKTLEEDVNGKKSCTDIYVIKIKSAGQWNIVKNSRLTDDAGPARVLKLEEILHKSNDYFAFRAGEVLKEFIQKHYPKYAAPLHHSYAIIIPMHESVQNRKEEHAASISHLANNFIIPSYSTQSSNLDNLLGNLMGFGYFPVNTLPNPISSYTASYQTQKKRPYTLPFF